MTTQLWGDLHRRAGKPDLVLHFAMIEGRPECVGIEVGARVSPPGSTDRRWRLKDTATIEGPLRPISAADVRGLGLGEEVRRARAKMIRDLRIIESSGDLPKRWRAEARERLALVEKDGGRRPGRPRMYDAEHFRKVADFYREGATNGLTPTRWVARKYGVSQSTAAKWVARARSPEYGFLPPTTRGRARAHGASKKTKRSRRGTT